MDEIEQFKLDVAKSQDIAQLKQWLLQTVEAYEKLLMVATELTDRIQGVDDDK